ncbi:MAG TPA: PEP-CTERM sorting domain-containing protein, partial [Opitutus sp.]|nr:PEP-CTERM sorting domain-containing protein [Opitutus sp.]
VPEPSTYAAWGAALLVGFVAYRRFRAGKNVEALPAAA